MNSILSSKDFDFHKNTYQVFEIDFMNAVKKVLPKELKPRDIYLIQVVKLNTLNKQNTMSKIAEDVHMSPSKLSNNIDFLVKHSILSRERSENDRRVIYVELTEKGLKYYQDIQELISNALKYGLKKLSLFKTLRLSALVSKILKAPKGETKIKVNKNLSENLIKIYFNIIQSEDALLEKKQASITNHDLKVMTYMLFLDNEELTINDLTAFLQDPYTTIASAIQTLENKGLVSKEPGKLDKRQRVIGLTEQGLSIVSEHIKSRMDVARQTLDQIDAKHYKLIFEAYSYIKEFSNQME